MFYSGIFHNRFLEISIGIGTAVIFSIVTIKVFRKPKQKKITRIIDTMDFLRKKTVHIQNRDKVEEIVSQLIKGGASKLQVISDFDHTISRVHKDGKQCTSSYGVLESSPFVSDEYKHETLNLYNHYHPIEQHPKMTKEEKTPFMIEWYTKSMKLMHTAGFTKDNIPKMVEVSGICLRDDSDSVFQLLYKHNVPLLVFSAGIGDVLKQVLKQNNLLYPNVKIIANFIQYNQENRLLGFKGDLIHTFNKNQSSLQNQDYFEYLKERNNVLLLGDSLGDLDMAEGLVNTNAILKIGFLNYRIEENLPVYLQQYDIVLTDDQTMEVVLGLLNSIL